MLLSRLSLLLADVSITPTADGAPGAAGIQKILNWAAQYGLWLALASFVLGGGMLGLASAWGNGMHAGKGREMVIGGGVGACVIGVAATAINLFHTAFN